MKKGDNVRLRRDGRFEARYIKERTETGKAVYGYCYGQTYEEALSKREQQLASFSILKGLNLLILGAGLHGIDVYEIARSLKVFSKIDFLDDNPNNERAIGCWNKVKELTKEYSVAIVAVGDEPTRQLWTKKLGVYGYCIPILIHPTAFVSEDAEIGIGTVINPGSIISSGVQIGQGCIIASGSSVPHKACIPDWSYFENGQIKHFINA